MAKIVIILATTEADLDNYAVPRLIEILLDRKDAMTAY